VKSIYLCLLWLAILASFNTYAVKIEPCDSQRCINYFNHFKKNAQRGHADSIATLAEFYYHGFGTPKNDVLAMKYYRKAARLGVVRSQYKIGLMFLSNERFKDNKRGIRYLEKAAYNRHSNAPYILSVLHYSDSFGEYDKVKADIWLAKAYRNLHPKLPEFIEHIYSYEDITESEFPQLYKAILKKPMVKTANNRLNWPQQDNVEVITVLSPDIDEQLQEQLMASRKQIKHLGSRMPGVDCRTSVACKAMTLKDVEDSLELLSTNNAANK
jgi:uncharacterized protein